MITIESLSKRYGKQKVLKSVSLELKQGQAIGLIGPNGSGKTTLLKSILGLVIPDNGMIVVNDHDIIKGYKYRQYIGYMSQISRFPENITVSHLFAMIKKMRAEFKEQIDTELYNKFNIEKMKDKHLGTLSGGMRQQVSAALAFYFNPSILILDEPTAGLDPISNEILRNKINSSTEQNKLIITTSHVLSDLDKIASHVIYMMDGEILFFDDLEKLQQRTSEKTLDKMILKLVNEEHHV